MLFKKVYEYESPDGNLYAFEISELPSDRLAEHQVKFEAAGKSIRAMMQAGRDFIAKCCPAYVPEETGLPLYNWLLENCINHNGLGKKPEAKLDEAKNE